MSKLCKSVSRERGTQLLALSREVPQTQTDRQRMKARETRTRFLLAGCTRFRVIGQPYPRMRMCACACCAYVSGSGPCVPFIEGGRALQSPAGLRVRRLGTLRRAAAFRACRRCYGRDVRSLTLSWDDCGALLGLVAPTLRWAPWALGWISL